MFENRLCKQERSIQYLCTILDRYEETRVKTVAADLRANFLSGPHKCHCFGYMWQSGYFSYHSFSGRAIRRANNRYYLTDKQRRMGQAIDHQTSSCQRPSAKHQLSRPTPTAKFAAKMDEWGFQTRPKINDGYLLGLKTTLTSINSQINGG